MRYLSVCSGIEAATTAWHPLGWEAVAFSEIEKFPCAVLAHHYPDTTNWGDMTRFQEWPDANIDVLVGGTPCQSFSVAGLRKGLADPRGNLMLTYLAIAAKYRPQWLVWENVPGVLSSNGGRDFCSLLGGLEELGYGFAYRILNAEYFGVAQRRRRVFVVGHFRDSRRAAAVLFERQSLSGHPPPSREARQVAPTIHARSLGGGGLGTDFDCDGGLIASHEVSQPLLAKGNSSHRADAESYVVHGTQYPCVNNHIAFALGCNNGQENVVFQAQPYEVANCLTARMFKGINSTIDEGQTPIVVQNPLVSKRGYADASPQETDTRALLRGVRDAIGKEAFAQWGLGILDSLQSPEILREALHGSELRPAAFSRRWVVDCALSRSESRGAGAVQSMLEAKGPGCSSQGWEPSEQRAIKLGAYLSELSQPGSQAERFMLDLWWAAEGLGVMRQALSAVQAARRPVGGEWEPVKSGTAVRRLTVEECEFLQGFPRGYTLIPYRGKPANKCANGPRYKALGNSMAVPVMRWIGERIQSVSEIPKVKL